MAPPATITQLLIKWRDGDKAALDELARRIYGELRGLARYYLRQERPCHTLQPSDLVHEAFLRLVNEKDIDWQNRAHFFGIAAVRMRHILVEHARGRRRPNGAGARSIVAEQIGSPGRRTRRQPARARRRAQQVGSVGPAEVADRGDALFRRVDD